MEWLADFFTAVVWWQLLLILVAKTIEVALGTLRVILITKGYRTIGTILSFIEIMMWVFIASNVLKDISEAPIKGIVYGMGFSLGIFLGSKVEGWLAFGKIFVQIITSVDNNDDSSLIKVLRNAGYGATIIDAKGKDNDKQIIMVIANRKKKDVLFGLIETTNPQAVVISHDVSTLRGGYIKAWKKIIK